MSSKQKFLFLGIIFLAIFFRYYQINKMPGGLFPDEAANGLDINLMQAGHLQPFYERGNGREALFFYLEWGSVALFGKGVWQFSVVSSLVGVVSVIMCYFVARRLFMLGAADGDQTGKNRATNIGLLAAFLMAVNTWHIVLSRTAFRAIMVPLLTSLTFYFLIRAYQAVTKKSRLWFALLTGAAFAGGFYTYISFRIMIPVLFVLLLWPLLGAARIGEFKQQVKKYFLPAVLFLAAFIIVFFPIGRYFYQHPGSFVGRAGQVSIFNPSLYTYDGVQLTGKPPISVVVQVFAEVVKTQLLGFFTHGDLNWRQNISGYPFVSPLFSIFFAIGLEFVSWLMIRYFFAPNKKSGYWKYFLLGMWFWAFLLPVATTAESIPHGLRASGMITPTFIISAWALYEFAVLAMRAHRRLWQHIVDRKKDPHWVKQSSFTPPRLRLVNFGIKLVVVCFFAALILQSYFLYFVYAASSPENFYAFRSDLTPVSEYLVQRCNKQHTYLVLDDFSVQTTDYLTSDPKGNFSSPCNVPYQDVDPASSWKLSNLTAQDEVVFTQSTMFDTKKFKQYHPDEHLIEEVRNQFGQDVLAVYSINK